MKENILIVEDEFIVANDLSRVLKKNGFAILGIANSYHTALTLIKDQRPDMVILDIRLKGEKSGIDLAHILQSQEIPFLFLSANSNKSVLDSAKATNPFGFIVKPFREKDLLVSLEVAFYRIEHDIHYRAHQENYLLNHFKNLLGKSTPKHVQLQELAGILQNAIPFFYLDITYTAAQKIKGHYGVLRIGHSEYQISENKISEPCRENNGHPTPNALVQDEDFHHILGQDQRVHEIAVHHQLRSRMDFSIEITDTDFISLQFYGRTIHQYLPNHLDLLCKVTFEMKQLLGALFGITMEANQPSKEIPKQPRPEPIETSISTVQNGFDDFVGCTENLMEAFDNIRRVAPLDTSVLITGESGTGKELAAHCIHKLSSRKNKPLVVINCASLPANLIESLLFGHEKGAFTGSLERRIGKFEQAHGGTIFLDEIGEMPLELQVKLLRVLQEKEFDRIGGSQPIKVDVRIIAATNRNLEEEVAQGNFRLDLYYRLNVFPIELPTLRERSKDIPLLVEYFAEATTKKHGLPPVTFTKNIMQRLSLYHWPGNVRELQHYVERSILLSDHGVVDTLYSPVNKNALDGLSRSDSPLTSLREMERSYIIRVLQKCNGKVFGSGGAAEILNIPTSTLNSKIKKLGIQKSEIYGETS